MTVDDDGRSVRVAARTARRHCERTLEVLGVPHDQAEIVAETLVDADLRGISSHGLHLLRLYERRLRSGEIRAETTITIEHDEGATVRLHGGLGLGQVAGLRGIDLACERAAIHGLASVAVRETSHLGALGYYTRRAARAGFVAMAWQNGPTFVPPYGGLTPVFSTNPFSYALPAATEPPVVFDVASTTVAGNKILLAQRRGVREIPSDWATDSEGRPTSDPALASVDRLQWFGGHKGFGIAFLVEALAGVLTGSSFGHTDVTDAPSRGRERAAKGCCFLALDPARFLPDDSFPERVDALIQDVRASEPAAGHDRVRVPGEIEEERYADQVATGLLVPMAIVQDLERLSGQQVPHRAATDATERS